MKETAERHTEVAAVPHFRLSDEKPVAEAVPVFRPVQIVGGRFVLDGKVVWGASQTEAWWRGDTSIYTAALSTGSSVTRFMPGVVAPGETEDLKEMVARLKSRNTISLQVNPGLWYEHRRDAHTVERRDDGNVWAPFYEPPWARSGKGIAWDGLSRFDVSRYNPWYFERQREFARDASEAGLIVFYDLYNTHNVLEIGPHWIDYAWRPANNINDTGLPEPPPLKPHGRNDVGNEFYGTGYAPLRELHRAYILHTLDELGDMPNVIFGIAYQYAGPLEFEQFFQDTVREWEQKHGKKIRIALTTSKGTTDAILADPVRCSQIAVVDMRYWEYRPDGSLFAPKAGINRAFREQIAAEFPGYTDTPPPTTPEQVYREVREYRDRYPGAARRLVMRALIEDVRPDVMGTQEGMYRQIKDLAADLPEYAWIGMGRDGGSRGEFMAVFYRRERFEPLEFDHFWLSDTPDRIGSTTWGNSNRRMVTWVRFRELEGAQEFYFLNTHFDHQVQAARQKSAQLVEQRVEQLSTHLPIILVGDFNAAAGANAAYDTLVGKGRFTDTWAQPTNAASRSARFTITPGRPRTQRGSIGSSRVGQSARSRATL